MCFKLGNPRSQSYRLVYKKLYTFRTIRGTRRIQQAGVQNGVIGEFIVDVVSALTRLLAVEFGCSPL